MPKSNRNLNQAKKIKDDEFYTPYKVIEEELIDYWGLLKGKTIYCNTDNEQSEFVKYFKNNADNIGYKELLYCSSDFREDESIEKLKKSDVVITNPPFSLRKEFTDQLFYFKKDFLILAPLLAISAHDLTQKIWQKEIFAFNPHSYSYFLHNGDLEHVQVIWLTTLKANRTKPVIPPLYPRYDNYDAIDVPSIKLIKKDYDGVMGVPITFPLYEEIINNFELVEPLERSDLKINGKNVFKRFLIRRKKNHEPRAKEPEPSANVGLIQTK